MACPYMQQEKGVKSRSDEDEDKSSLTYTSYLHINDLLQCQVMQTTEHDEHLFIVIHQVYELWFKQVLHEVDSVRGFFSKPVVDERKMLKVNSRLQRIVKIFTVLVDQINILETMTPLDFATFRGELGTSSGFQSCQFRLIENKIGVKSNNRIQYNRQDYKETFDGIMALTVKKSEEEPSLADLVTTWLERTPGLETETFDFWTEFMSTCEQWFSEETSEAEHEHDKDKQEKMREGCRQRREHFQQILIEENYMRLVERGDRSLTWAAFKGALMIYYNRDEVLFHEPFQMLSLLMDIDVLLTKWRSAHVLLVQRMIGSKTGTGGSSGYFYLRSTVGDKYRPFLDLFQLSNYLIPKKFVKQLQISMSKHSMNTG